MKRNFLFLQGVASPFFSRLGDRLARGGHGVFRVNFCAGDALYWPGRPAWNFRDKAEALRGYLGDRYRDHAITDIVLFGDQRPIHRPAVELARSRGMRVHVFEEGYVRPNWITLERGGVNAASALPRDPRWYLEAEAAMTDPGEGMKTPPSLAARAAHDMAYHAANLANCLAFPGYRTHRPYVSAVEYAGWARRFAGFPWRRRRDARRIAELARNRTPFYLLPLQLNADAQITRHSRFGHMGDVIECVLRSFSAHASVLSRIVIKNHPLDTGLADYPGLIRRLARELDLTGRVLYLETGHLPTLLDHALGVVVVNSTVGLSALQHLRPTKALGTAIYDLPGLTFQGGLDDFWHGRQPPDLELCRAFRNVVVRATQINGDLYTARGIDMAVAGCGGMLEALSPLERLLAQVPATDGPEYRVRGSGLAAANVRGEYAAPAKSVPRALQESA